MPHAALLDELARLARRAGEAVMAVYATDFDTSRKEDASPVTQADHDAEAIITDGLSRLTPDIPIVAEEAVSSGAQPRTGERFWLVDPLDGTREFIKRNGEFTVNIALVENGRPTMGVVLAPAMDRLYAGHVDDGAWVDDGHGRRPLACRDVPPSGLTVAASRSHGDPAELSRLLQDWPVEAVVPAGSSLKLCLVAEGVADCYPRQGRTMEWDIAAGHAVLRAAGGSIRLLDDPERELGYDKPGLENPHFVAGSDAFHRRWAAKARRPT